MDLTTILVAAASSIATAVVVAVLNWRKVAADVGVATATATKVRKETEQNETAYYRERVEDTITQMRVLEAQIVELKAAIEDARRNYERRVGGLHTKIDALKDELERANTALDTANQTITELREEVKMGNATVAELRAEIRLLYQERQDR